MQHQLDEELLRLIEKRMSWEEILAKIGRSPIKWRKTGPGYTLCVIHQEKRPSLTLRPSGSWHYYGCGQHGRGKVAFMTNYFDWHRTPNTEERVAKFFRGIISQRPNPWQLVLPYDDIDSRTGLLPSFRPLCFLLSKPIPSQTYVSWCKIKPMQRTTALTKSAITFSLIKNRHVGQFTEGYPLTNGVTVAVDTLVQNLPSNFKSTIVAPEAGNQNDPADVLRIPAIGELWEYPIAQPWRTKHLVHYFANNGLDLVHVHHPFLMGMVGAKIAKKFKVPLVAHHHTLYETYGHYVKLPTSISDRIAKYGLGPWLHWYYDIFAECATIIVPSKATETSLRQMGVEASIRVIPTGVPLPKSEDISPAKQQEIRRRYGIKSEDFLLLYVGRLAKEKNLDLALQAFDALANEHTNLHFLFVGSGPEEESLREQAAQSIAADRIHFAGRQPRELLDPFYAAGDLFVFPSTTETQGLVTAEAQVAGTPSVVVNVGGACELVTDGVDGLVTAPTVADLSQSIRSILTNPTLHATLKQGCITNRSKRTPEAMIEQVLDVYESVLAR